MSDRELLELAAKAAGYDVFAESRKVSRGNDCLEHFIRVEGRELIWNPLTDDGDAFRLIVKLKHDDKWTKEMGASLVHGFHDGDPYAATRRAIVRCAAELGRALP